MDNYLETADRITKQEFSLDIKSRCLTMYTSVLLLSVDQGNIQFNDFVKCVSICCESVVKGLEGGRAGAFGEFKSQCSTIFSRFYLLRPVEMTEFICSKVDLKNFIRGWLQCMSSISSKKASRVNSFAVFAMLSNIQVELIYEDLGLLLEQTLTDVIFEIEGCKN